MMSKYSLEEISAENFAALRDKYSVDYPKHIAAFTLLHTLSKRHEKQSIDDKKNENMKVLSMNGDWQSDGTFIAIFDTNVSFGTLDPAFARLKQALALIDYNRMLFFMCIPDFYVPMFLEVAEQMDLMVKIDIPGTMVHMTKVEAKNLKYEIPSNFRLGSLTASTASLIKTAWTHGSDFSVKTIPYLIEHNTSVGLFDADGELVAWCLVFDFGSLAALQVDENHYRKGYGEIVTRAITKKIAEENDVDVTSNYVDGNIRSHNLVTKIGFKKIDSNRWIGVYKKSELSD